MKKHLLLTLLSLTFVSGTFAQVAAPTACIAEFKKIITESDKLFADGLAKKTINPDDGAAYKKRDAAMQKQFDTLVADKKLNAMDCANFVKTANTEKSTVIKMSTAK
ncbi:MAG: hypothetical protein RLY82_709 [Pseudomonadota bacterium]|jgi:hypothetical protein